MIMSLISKLTEGTSISVGLGEAAAVYAIYNQALPNGRMTAPHNTDIESARKGAALKSAAILSVIFLLSHDLNSYIIGGVALVGVDYMYKHQNAVHPNTGKLDTSTAGASVAPTLSVAYPMSDYSEDAV